ncbi:MAG: hypothetical protein HYZ51_00185 [Candidatus Doudnabacteria bacterium]|nr:hypothetical protein [Candidatus Doudnabacteria bacterium]
MKTLKSLFTIKVSALFFVGVLGAASSILALAPRKIAITKAESCQGAPTVATLNPFPVSWAGITGSDCTDAPAIAIRPVNSPTGSYSQNVDAQSGDEFYLRVYVHNGAQQGLDPNQTTAFAVQGGINIAGGQIATDFDGTRADGSLTNTVYGSVSVNMPQGARLELIPGSEEFFDYQATPISGYANLKPTSGFFDLGDMSACFEFSKFLRVKVKVVGGQTAPQNPTGTISGQVGSRVSGQCVYSGTIAWQTQNAGEVEVTVRDPENAQEKVFAQHANENGAPVNWLEPNKNYHFTVWRMVNGQRASFYAPGHNLETWIQVPDLNCGVTPAGNPSGNIAATPATQVASQCLFQTAVTWSTQDVSNAQVTVRNPDTGAEAVHSTELNGTSTDTAWMLPNRNYRFSLWNVVGGLRQTPALDDVWVTTGSCQTVPVIDYNFNPLKSEYCVGETPQYVITANSHMAGKKILWSSWKNNQPTGELDADYGFFLTLRDNQAVWNEYGSTWLASHIGSWRKEANIEGVRKSVTFQVRDCSTPTQLVCLVTPSVTANINQVVLYTAQGGGGAVSWSNATGNPSNPVPTSNASTYSTRYATPGIKTVIASNTSGQTCKLGKLNHPRPIWS